MKIEQRKLSDIKPYEQNPRHNDAAIDTVAASIAQFGFRQPIVVDKDMVIVVGHTRCKAAQKLGLEKVPVHVARELTEDQARAYRIADNQSANLSTWDFDLLSAEILDLQNNDFDIDLLGFSAEELARISCGQTTDGHCDEDDVPLPPDEAVTQPGGLWILGNHRLLCGDSRSVIDVDRLLDGNSIQLVNTDPPYNVKVEPRSNNAIAAGLSSFAGNSHHQGLDLSRHPGKSKPTQRKLRAKDRPLANDFVTDEAFDKLLEAWFGNISRVLLPGRSFYIWGARFVRTVFQAAGIPVQESGPTVSVHVSAETPRALRQAMGRDDSFNGRFDLPHQEGEIYLGRTSPIVEGLAGWTIDQALDPAARDARPIASRCGVVSTSLVKARTTLVIARFRFHLKVRGDHCAEWIGHQRRNRPPFLQHYECGIDSEFI